MVRLIPHLRQIMPTSPRRPRSRSHDLAALLVLVASLAGLSRAQEEDGANDDAGDATDDGAIDEGVPPQHWQFDATYVPATMNCVTCNSSGAPVPNAPTYECIRYPNHCTNGTDGPQKMAPTMATGREKMDGLSCPPFQAASRVGGRTNRQPNAGSIS